MSTLVVERSEPRLFDADGGLTLDELIVGAWDDLAVAGLATCPACAEELLARYDSAGTLADGRCPSCGSSLG